MIIYLIRNLVNGKGYIGQTIKPLAHRWNQHVRNAKYGKRFPLHHAIRKYGAENFEVCVLAKADTLPELNLLEEFHIQTQGTMAPAGYNAQSGGLNFIRTQEQRQKISESKRGIKLSEEVCRKNAIAHLGIRSCLGVKHSEQARRNMGLAHVGKTHSEETKLKMSKSHTGKPKSHKGKPWSEARRKAQKLVVIREVA